MIFLDFDGVIRLCRGTDRHPDSGEFSPGRMAALGELCRQYGWMVVISSDWRNAENEAEIRGHLAPHLDSYLHDDWATPIIGARSAEVERWLENHPEVERYAILEDCSFHFKHATPAMQNHICWCDSNKGITRSVLRELVDVME